MAGGNSVGVGQTSSNLSDGVGVSIRVSLPLADGVVEATIGESVVGVVGGVAMSNTVVHCIAVDVAQRVGGVGDDTGVVGMAGGNSVGVGQTSSNLSDGVGVSIRVSLPLADGVVEPTIGEHVVGGVAGGVGDVADVSGVVGPTGVVGIGPGNAGSHLAEGVGIGVSVS